MKLRTSLCNPTALKKDVTRFAPVWVLYTVGLFMILTVVMTDYNEEYYKASNLAESLGFMAALNLGYGFLNGQLLFGDLFNARHCNALHAMPLRRECWFVTHVIAGLLFALVPNALMALVALPMLDAGWSVALWWYLATALQYLFFFGLAALSALCVGNRFAMLLIYGIVNFFALIVYWFYHTIYEPLLYGVYISEDPFLLWCPVWSMAQAGEDLVLVERRTVEHTGYYEYLVQSVTPGSSWWYLVICAVLGIALLAIALLLYRRRKLESAGDFMAVQALEPVFLVLYSLCMAAGFQVFAELFGADEYLFLAIGLIVGFFTGRMLLMRTTRVFQAKGFMLFGILAAVFIASMVLTWLDPLGVTRYIPDADDIREVKLSTSYNPQYGNEPYLTEEADIEAIRQLHQMVLDGQHTSVADTDGDYYNNLTVYYVMDYGTVTRKYDVAVSSPVGQMAQSFYTRPEFVLGTDDVDAFMKDLNRVYFDSYLEGASGETYLYGDNAAYVRGLVEAILADCREGTMAQSYDYHDTEHLGWIEFSFERDQEWYNYVHITFYADNRHTVAYLEENPFPFDTWDEEVYG